VIVTTFQGGFGVRYLRVGLTVTVASLVLASVAGAVVTHKPNGHRISVMLKPGAKAPSAAGTTKGSGVLISHGGPVLAAEAPYLIFWTPTGHPISSASESLMDTYQGDVAAASGKSTTNVYSVLAQYGSPYSQTFGRAQAVTDTNPYPSTQGACPLATGMTACVTDASLQAEIGNLIDAGTLPSPGAPGSGTTPIFFVITPVDVNVCISGNQCSSNNFCAYHDYFGHGGSNVLYASVPFSVFANDPKGCQTDQYSIYETPVGSNGDQAYNIADDLSHELSETITDPLVNAWYSGNGLEVGDLCEAYGARANTQKGLSPLAYSPAFGTPSTGTLYDQVINGDQYYNQTEFSNSANKCLAGTTALK
jgi:hypothetical protein